MVLGGINTIQDNQTKIVHNQGIIVNNQSALMKKLGVADDT